MNEAGEPTDLIPHQTVTMIVENVEQAKAEVAKAFELLLGAKKRLQATLGDSNYYSTVIPSESRFGDSAFENGADASHKLITRNAWTYIMEQTQLTHYMTPKRKKELEEQIKSDSLPLLTVENITGTLMGLAGRINQLLEESIKDVFLWLRPLHDRGVGALKTNKKYYVSKKTIVGWAVERGYSREGGFRINYHRDANFRALGNVFSLLDGRGVLKYPDDFITRFNEKMKGAGAGDKYEDEYFIVKCYRNQNAHIQFKRLDLLFQLNKIGSDGGLPGKENSDR